MVNGVNVIEYDKKDCITFNSYRKGKYQVLSNLYDKCKIPFDGYIFHSSEQIFFYLLLEDCDEGRKKVMFTPSAKESKKKGSYYLKKRGWDDSKEECQRAEVQALRAAIGLKMKFCEEFRNVVLETDKKIVEYAPWNDAVYGTVDVDEKYKWNYNEGIVRGQNICGRIIQQWRKWYRNGEYREMEKSLGIC